MVTADETAETQLNNTVAATKPTDPRSRNVTPQPWSLRMISDNRKELTLKPKLTIPLDFTCETSNRNLSMNDPTITKALPAETIKRKIWGGVETPQLSVSPGWHDRATRNAPPIVRHTPIGKTRFNSATPSEIHPSIGAKLECAVPSHLVANPYRFVDL
jgi:hypothetical protein